MANQRDSVIFVCTANICRSPIAEKLLAHALAAEQGPVASLRVLSAGVSAFEGDAPSPYSVKVLKSIGLDLGQHRSQRMTQDLVERAFAIFCMTSTHKLLLEHQFGEDLPKHVLLMTELIDGTRSNDIADPYGLELADYEACRDSMLDAIPAIVDFLKREYTPNTHENQYRI